MTIIKEEKEDVVIVERSTNKQSALRLEDVIEIEDDDNITSGENNNKQEEVAVSYPNNIDTEKDHHWWYNGKSRVRTEKKRGHVGADKEDIFEKKYYVCAEKKKNKGGCKAMKMIHALPNGNSITFKGEHNHPPSTNPKIDPEVKRKIMDQLSVGAKPSVIHSSLINNAINNAEAITRKNVPRKQQIHNWQHQMAMAQLPTSMFIITLIIMYASVNIQ